MPDIMEGVTAHPKTAIWDPHQKVYKFIDPATGLFWDGNFTTSKGRTLFSTTGIEFKSKKAADEAWRGYEVNRSQRPELPELRRKTFKVVFHEEKDEGFDAEAEAINMVVTRFIVRFGKKAHLTQFVRQLQDSAPNQFRYIIERKMGGKPNKDAMEVLTAMNAPRLSSNQSKKRYIAVRSEADLIYLKMGMNDQFQRAFEIETAKEL